MTLHQFDRLVGKDYESVSPCTGVTRNTIKVHSEEYTVFFSMTQMEYVGDLIDIWAQENGVEPFFRFYGNAKDCPDIPENIARLFRKN